MVLLADGMVRVLDLGMYIFEIGVGERRHRCSPPNKNAPGTEVPGALQKAWRAGQRVLVLSPFCCQIRRALAMCAATDSVTGL